MFGLFNNFKKGVGFSTSLGPTQNLEKKRKDEELQKQAQNSQVQNFSKNNFRKKNTNFEQKDELIIPGVNDGNFKEPNSDLIIPGVNDIKQEEVFSLTSGLQQKEKFSPYQNQENIQNISPQGSQQGEGENQAPSPALPLGEEKGVENTQNVETKKDIETSQGEFSQSEKREHLGVSVGQNSQNIDYQNWNVEAWKSRGSSKEELENAIEKKYGTVASWKEDGSLEAVINGEKFSWKIDENGNPVKTSLGSANQVDINKGQVSQMIQNGNTIEEINDYIHKNNLQDDPDIKNQLKQKYIADYEKPILQKFKNYSLKDLHEAVKKGEILPDTEVFNKLPQAQAYNQYAKSFAIIDARKDSDFEAVNSTIEIEKIVEKSISKFFDTRGIEEITKRFKNDEEIKQYRADVYESQKRIIEYKRQMKEVGDRVRQQMSGAPESLIMSEISRQAENIYRGIETETALMNASLGMIGDRKQDFEVEMKMLGYKDNMKKEQYMQGLNLYRYERDRMDSFKKMELQYKNQELAFNRQHQAQKEIMELQQKYKGGTYQVGVDGSLNYIVNGQAQKVKFDDGQVLFTSSRQDMIVQTKLNEDGTFSVYSVSKDGKNVNIQNLDMEGNLIAGMPNRIADALSKVGVDGKQCAEGVNDYLNQLGIKGRYVPSEWSGKKALINSENPVIGGLAIWNPASVGSKNHQYGHVGIVESVSPDGKYVYISDWNADGVSEKFTRNRKVPISEITKTGGFNRPPIKITKESGNFNSIAGDTDLRNSEWRNKYPNEASFKNNNTAGITWNANFENPKPGTNAYILQQNGINFHKGTARPSREGGHYVAFDNVEDGIKAHYLMLKNSPQTVRERLKDWVGIGNIDAYAKEVFAGSGLDLSLLDKPLNSLSDSELTPLLKSQIKRESSGMYRYLEQNNWLQNFQAPVIISGKNSKNSITSSGSSAGYNNAIVDNNSSGYSSEAQTWIEAIQKGKQTLAEVFSTLGNSKEMAGLKAEIQRGLLVKTPENQQLDEISASRESKMLKTLNWLLDDKNAGTRESATGKVNWSWTNWYAGDRDDYLAEMNFILDNETLTALSNAKNNGVTFGSLSGTELETVHKSATALNGLAERDANGKITGFNGSEARFVELLKDIQSAYQKAYSRKTGKNLNDAKF